VKRLFLLISAALMFTFALGSVAYAGYDEDHDDDRGEIVGTADDDYFKGSPHKDDTIYGLGGDDTLRSFSGDDDLYGGADNDTVRGGGDDDYVHGGPGYDTLRAGRGSDFVAAADGEKDYVNCGGGAWDKASVDEEDSVKKCEIVNGKKNHDGDEEDDWHKS
jgi:Ca2+-binding RTX toxin-like protein